MSEPVNPKFRRTFDRATALSKLAICFSITVMSVFGQTSLPTRTVIPMSLGVTTGNIGRTPAQWIGVDPRSNMIIFTHANNGTRTRRSL